MKLMIDRAKGPDVDGIAEAYGTTDFEFVAFAMTYQNPEIDLIGLIPNKAFKGRDKNFVQYTFLVLGKGDEWYDQLEKLSFDYVNGRTMIEPTALAAKRKWLRGHILAGKNKKFRGMNRTKSGVSKNGENKNE
jgi:hypothetical protein